MQQKKILAGLLSLTLLAAPAVPAAAYDSAGPGYTQTAAGGSAESFLVDADGTLWAPRTTPSPSRCWSTSGR